MIKGIGRFPETRYGFCIVVLCQGQQTAQDFHSFVAIEPQHYKYFEQHYAPGKHDSFQHFGTELYRITHKKPSAHDLDVIERKYNVEFDMSSDFMERLLGVIQKIAFQFPLKPAVASGSH